MGKAYNKLSPLPPNPCIKDGKLGETYLFGGDGERENIWIVKKILEYLDKPESLIVHVGDRKGHDVRYAIDNSKSERER